MYIAIDTSTDTASLVLVQDSRILAELTWCCGQNHNTQLLPRLSHLLDQTGLNIESAEGIIVARGPGSYTGLRVGISTAKGLAFSLGIPVVGIGTLEVEAYQHTETSLPICSIINAGRSELAAAVYQMKGKKWSQLVAESIITIDMLCSQIVTKTLFCGEFVPYIAIELKKRLKQNAIIPRPTANLRRAGFLAELGLERLKAGDYDDAATLQPLYLRAPAITQPRNKEGKSKQ